MPIPAASPAGPTVSVVIPAMNEAANLLHVLPRIPAWVHELILVDGASTDGTAEVARALWPGVRVVGQERRGKGVALRAGFAAATGDIVVMLDADGSMDPAEIGAYVDALLAGADFAKGTRFAKGGGTDDITALRRLGNAGLTWLVRRLHGGGFSDLCYGYAAFWRRVLPTLALTSDGFEIETEMNLRALRGGLRVEEVPSFEAARIHGASNLNTFRDGWRVLATVLRETRTPTAMARQAREATSGGAGDSARRGGRHGAGPPRGAAAPAAGAEPPVAVVAGAALPRPAVADDPTEQYAHATTSFVSLG